MRLGETNAGKRNLTLLPLIDVIFLLLIFFMFSSNLSPFSLLQLTGDRNKAGPDVQAADNPAEVATVSARQIDVMVLVDANLVLRVNGKRVDIAQLQTVLEEFRQKGAETLVIAPSRRASVQDLVGVLEAAKRSAIPSVAIRQ